MKVILVETYFDFEVINETVRLANIVPGLFRKVSKDVQIKGEFNFNLSLALVVCNKMFNIRNTCLYITLAGYTIPAGWLVMVASSVVHFTPEKYEDPLAFNPWRWEVRNNN